MTATMDIDGDTTGFESLPRDVQLRVVESLPAKDAVAFAGVNSACLSVYREVAGLGQFLKAIPREVLLENVLPRLDDEVDRVMFSRVNKSCRLAIPSPAKPLPRPPPLPRASNNGSQTWAPHLQKAPITSNRPMHDRHHGHRRRHDRV